MRKMAIILLIVLMVATLIFAEEYDYNEQTEGSKSPIIQIVEG